MHKCFWNVLKSKIWRWKNYIRNTKNYIVYLNAFREIILCIILGNITISSYTNSWQLFASLNYLKISLMSPNFIIIKRANTIFNCFSFFLEKGRENFSSTECWDIFLTAPQRCRSSRHFLPTLNSHLPRQFSSEQSCSSRLEYPSFFKRKTHFIFT